MNIALWNDDERLVTLLERIGIERWVKDPSGYSADDVAELKLNKPIGSTRSRSKAPSQSKTRLGSSRASGAGAGARGRGGAVAHPRGAVASARYCRQ
jgi:hypothetical protein